MTVEEILEQMCLYAHKQAEQYQTPLKSITRHMVGLFQGLPGARQWRQILSTQAHHPDATPELIKTAYRQAFNK